MLTDMDILFSSRSKIIIIKYGSANVTEIPKFRMEKRPPERLLKCCFSTITLKLLKLPFTNKGFV